MKITAGVTSRCQTAQYSLEPIQRVFPFVKSGFRGWGLISRKLDGGLSTRNDASLFITLFVLRFLRTFVGFL